MSQKSPIFQLITWNVHKVNHPHLLGGEPTTRCYIVYPPRKVIDILCGIMHGEAAKLWWARTGDPKLHKDKNLTEVMLKTKNIANLHSEHNKPRCPAELGCESGNRPRETQRELVHHAGDAHL